MHRAARKLVVNSARAVEGRRRRYPTRAGGVSTGHMHGPPHDAVRLFLIFLSAPFPRNYSMACRENEPVTGGSRAGAAGRPEEGRGGWAPRGCKGCSSPEHAPGPRKVARGRQRDPSSQPSASTLAAARGARKTATTSGATESGGGRVVAHPTPCWGGASWGGAGPLQFDHIHKMTLPVCRARLGQAPRRPAPRQAAPPRKASPRTWPMA